VANDSTEVKSVTDGYFVPQVKAIRFSSKRNFNKQQEVSGCYESDEDGFFLHIDGLSPKSIVCPEDVFYLVVWFLYCVSA